MAAMTSRETLYTIVYTECFHSILRDTTDKEQGGHVGVPNNRR